MYSKKFRRKLIEYSEENMRTIFWTPLLLACLVGCSKLSPTGSSANEEATIASYCPYLPSKSFDSAITVSGKAVYQFRKNGNGKITDGSFYLKPSTSSSQPYTILLNGFSLTSTMSAGSDVVSDLKAQIEGNSSLAAEVNASSIVDYYGDSALMVSPKNLSNLLTVSNTTSNMDMDGGNPSSIRFAEIRVYNSNRELIQCAETDSTGAFSFSLPSESGSYTVYVTSRSNNTHNAAYVMNTPSSKSYYSVSTSVDTSSSTYIVLTAKASGDQVGGAFNILDQILNAQAYVADKTANCDQVSSSNYFSGCQPFTVTPVVNVYWSPGVNPGTYIGYPNTSLSFYLMGKSELYILGGLNGNSDNTDMDQYDNSVIIHEFGHFLEDTFATSDSPGGSHNGNSVIDPRLAWSEGFAYYFQAVILGSANIRDTYGSVDCSAGSSCTGVLINEDLDPSGTPSHDAPLAGLSGEDGEGNFREWSVTRILWDATKSGGAGSIFAEFWATLTGTSSLKTSGDSFNSISRFHYLQNSASGKTDWTSIRSNEKQTPDNRDYANPISTSSGCSPSSMTMMIKKTATDNGSFSTSDLFRHNDFYTINHAGGTFNLTLDYSATDAVDLDLYVYKTDYTFGSSASIVASSKNEGTTSSGSESISTTLDAGTYMINVFAYTGLYCESTDVCQSFHSSSRTATYSMKYKGTTICPTF